MSLPKPIPPTITTDDSPMGGTVKSHPAFGMLGWSRVQGDPGNLFGSEIKRHMGFVELTLMDATERRTLSRSWFYGHRVIAKVHLSHSAFAEFITTPNSGNGVPCTITYLPGEEKPGIKDEDTVHEQIKADLREDTAELVANATKLKADLAAAMAKTKLSKTAQEEITKLADRLISTLTSSMPFVLDSYQEATEEMRQKAATEVEAMVAGVAARLGFDSIHQLAAVTKAEQKALT